MSAYVRRVTSRFLIRVSSIQLRSIHVAYFPEKDEREKKLNTSIAHLLFYIKVEDLTGYRTWTHLSCYGRCMLLSDVSGKGFGSGRTKRCCGRLSGATGRRCLFPQAPPSLGELGLGVVLSSLGVDWARHPVIPVGRHGNKWQRWVVR